MRNPDVVSAILSATALVACSGGGGPSGGEGPGDGAGSNVPPASPPASGPVPSLPLPPVESLTCSPCKKITFSSTRDGNDEIYSVNADGTDLTRLTDDDSNDREPTWSPDGLRIAFTSDRESDGESGALQAPDLYVMDADGSNVERLTFSKGGDWPAVGVSRPTWAPDGSRITFETLSEGSANLWEVPAEGGHPRLLFSSPGFDGQPAWSPDGTRLALISDWFAYDIVSDIFLINADGSGFTAITDGNIFDQTDYEDPAWSHDGGTIALTVSRRVGTFEYITWLGLMNASGSDLTPLITPGGTSLEGAGVATPSWSPDGSMIAYTSCNDGRCDVAWIKADRSARGTVIENGRDPDWQR